MMEFVIKGLIPFFAMPKSNKAKFLRTKELGIFFYYRKKRVSITKLEFKVGESKERVDVGEVLHEISNIYSSKIWNKWISS